MSTSEQKSNLSLWAWSDPKCPLGRIKAAWIETGILPPKELQELSFNQALNPDPRIVKSSRVLLDAIRGLASGHSAHLLRLRTAQRSKLLMRRSPPFRQTTSGS